VREKTRSTANREKRKQKALEKAETKKEKRVDEFAKYRDDVKFGEVVHGPPQLTVLPRKSSRVDVCNVSASKRKLRKPHSFE
jgi:predicted nucleic acid-binding Zn ribbon protein